MSLAIVTPITVVLGLAAGLLALAVLVVVLVQVLGRPPQRQRALEWSTDVVLWIGAGAAIVLAIGIALLLSRP